MLVHDLQVSGHFEDEPCTYCMLGVMSLSLRRMGSARHFLKEETRPVVHISISITRFTKQGVKKRTLP